VPQLRLRLRIQLEYVQDAMKSQGILKVKVFYVATQQIDIAVSIYSRFTPLHPRFHLGISKRCRVEVAMEKVKVKSQ
jgi:hypothetical protein